MYRAPQIDVYKYCRAQTKAVRGRHLWCCRELGGVCLTSYGIVANNREILATDHNGRDFYWVSDNALLCLNCGWTESAGWPKINESTLMTKAHKFRAVPRNFENRHGFTRRCGKHCRGTLPNLMDST